MNYLIYRAGKEGTCFPAIKTIARDCHISVNTVKRALDDLTDAGYVQREARFIKAKNGAQTSNLYTLSEGMFASDEIDAAPGEAADASPGSRPMEPIPQEAFRDMTAAARSGTQRPEAEKQPDTAKEASGFRTCITGTAGTPVFFKPCIPVTHGWAAPWPILIPP